MKITPLDIRQKQFRTSFRGHDRKEVEAFLDIIASEFEEIIKENIAHKDDLKRQQQKLAEYRERERTLQETMVTAQRISEDMKAAAKKESEIILSEAELQAEKVVQNAHQRLVQIVEDINELKRQRTQFETQLSGIIEGHLKLLETFREAPGAPSNFEDKVAVFSVKKAAE